MTVVTPDFDLQKANHDQENHLDSSSTANMIFSENLSKFNRLSNVKILSGTLIILTILMGFFLLSAIYIQTASRCECELKANARTLMQEESQNGLFFEPLKSLSSSETSKEMRNLPLKIQMHGDARNLVNGNVNGGRISCEVTRKTASQVIASEPHELQTPFGNLTTDPKLLHLTGEKLFFTCYNGEKPKPVVLVARPRIFAIFHRDSMNNSTENDETKYGPSESEANSSKEANFKNVETEENKPLNKNPNNDLLSLTRTRREINKETMECTCSCPIKKN